MFEQATHPIFISTPPPESQISLISCSSGHKDIILVSKVAKYPRLYIIFLHTITLKCLFSSLNEKNRFRHQNFAISDLVIIINFVAF